jgi:DNA polymerase-3 subunit delta'
MSAEVLSVPCSALPWQAVSWQRLLPQLEANTLPHALLAAGPAGVGKYQFMWALATGLLCAHPSAGIACGKCRNCDLLRAGTHPDLLRVQPEADSRAIKIEQIRELIGFCAKTPGIASRKVVLLAPAEAMNTSSANALLKCLEEPSASTQLLLVSHQPSALPATVRSRCQVLAMGLPPQQPGIDWLTQLTGSADTAAQLLELTGGRPLQARDLYLEDGLERRQALQQALDSLLARELSALDFQQLTTELELIEVLALLQTRLDHVLRDGVLKQQGSPAIIAGFHFRDELARLQASIGHGANPNRQLTVEDCAARLVKTVGREPTKC